MGDCGFNQDWGSSELGSVGFGSGFSSPLAGSMSFDGTNDFSLVENSASFAPGTGDLTVEWWQRTENLQTNARIWSIGKYSVGCTAAVSFSAGNFYYWLGTGANAVGTSLGSHNATLNTWVHYAIVRSSGVVKAYRNGTNISGAGSNNSNNAAYNAGHYFAIATETADGVIGNAVDSTFFMGQITGFRYVVGAALYVSDFTPSRSLPSSVAGTKLLLNVRSVSGAYADSSGNGVSVTPKQGATRSALRPF
jgi:hypothetical protein